MPNPQQSTPDVPPGWPVEPPYMPAPRTPTGPAALQRAQYEAARYGQQHTVINNYYAAPPAQRRGPDVRQVLGWTAVGGIVTAALLAVATAAIALGLGALAMCVLALVVRGLWRDLRGQR